MNSSVNTMIYNFIQKFGRAYHKIKTKIYYGFFLKECGNGNMIINPILFNPHYFKFKNNILIRNAGRLEAVDNYLNKKYNPEITIGNNVAIEQNLHLTCADKITIGENTAIAANVTITDINHPYTNIALPPELQQIEVNPVIIGTNCKIYNNAVILPGTILGKHNIVGANAVVSGKFPDFCIIAGVPAKIIKQYNQLSMQWEKVGAIVDTNKID